MTNYHKLYTPANSAVVFIDQQPQMTFGGQELYPSLAEKAAALGFSLVCNHPFVDGNKRVGHAAMETFLVLNGWELLAGVDEQEQMILRLAAGTLRRDEFTAWVQSHLQQRPAEPGAAADRPRE